MKRRFGTVTRRCARVLTNESVVCSRRRRLAQLGLAASAPGRKIRRAGGGRLSLTRKDPTLLEDLRKLLEPATLGDPMRPLLWVSKSHAKLAAALRDMGHRVSASRI